MEWHRRLADDLRRDAAATAGKMPALPPTALGLSGSPKIDLLRKFPNAVIHECQSSQAALEMAKMTDLSAIVSHRTTETAGITLLREIRLLNPHVPLVMVSGVNRQELALAAGADRFMLYDEWLRIGTIVEELVASRSRGVSSPGR